jgi:23S rRNA pseudouridine1911/1915/1917 synthase
VPEIRIAPEQAGERLDVVLAGAAGSRSHAQRLIDEGRVTVDGRQRPKRHRVAAGEVVAWEGPEAPPVDPGQGPAAPFGIPYEDEHLLVVDKPAGVVVHPAPGHRSGTLSQALAGLAAGGEEPLRAGIVHRLDRDTSGLLVVARSEAVHRALRDLLERRAITREYLALVHGRPPARSGTIDAPVGRDRRVRTRMSTHTDEPREARSHFDLERAFAGTTLLRVRLETGRTHQIRVHLEAIGHPVVGDREYAGTGPPRSDHGLDRQFLHATRLAFRHPVTGLPVDVTSPLPEDLSAVLDALG